MKKVVLPILLFLVVAAVWVFNDSSKSLETQTTPIADATKEAVENTDKVPQKANFAYLHSIRANQHTGKVDLKDEARERVAVKQQIAAKSSQLTDDVEWEELGPNNVGGRTRALIIDIDNDQTLYAGSITGGLFKSTNAGQDWSLLPASIDAGCVAVSAMVQDENGDIYVGTGSDFESTAAGGAVDSGSGIFKSSDGGESFELLPGTSVDPNTPGDGGWAVINRLGIQRIDGNTYLYACTNDGLKVSSNGGQSWAGAELASGGEIPSAGQTADDVEVASDGTVYSLVGNGLYKAEDGINFKRIDSGGDEGGNLPVLTASRRVLISVSDSDPNYVYVAASSGSFFDKIWQSKDGGINFEVIGERNDSFDPMIAGTGTALPQCYYDFCLDVDPNNPEKLYLGAVRLWTWSNVDGWTQVENYFGLPSSPKWVHADKQGLWYHPTNSDILYITSDGGVSRTNNAQEAYPDFETLNKNYNTYQCYAIGAGHDGSVLAGSQDNGNQLLSYGFNSFQSSLDLPWGGDGGYTDISNMNPNVMFASGTDGSIARSTSAGTSFGCILSYIPDANGADPAISSGLEGECTVNGGASFIHPFVLWEDNRLFYEVTTWEPDEINMVENSNGDMVPEFTVDGQSYVVSPGDGPTENVAGFIGDFGEIEAYNDQVFIVTTDGEKYSEFLENAYTEETIYVGYEIDLRKKANDDGSFTYELVNHGFVMNPNDDRFMRARFILGSSSGDLWMTEDGLKPSLTPNWVNLTNSANIQGESNQALGNTVTAFDFSADGDRIVVGGAGGNVLIIDGLNSDELPTAKRHFAPFGSRFITDIAIDPSNEDRVLFSCGNYGNDAYVFESEDIDAETPTFEPRQGNLPKGPVYTIEVLEKGKETGVGNVDKDVLVGTKWGIWYAEKGDDSWEAQMNGVGQVPVYEIRQEPMARNPQKASDNWNSFVVYAGTHGRGMFRTTSLTDESIDPVVYELPSFAVSGEATTGLEGPLKDFASIKVFPNPVVDQATIECNFTKTMDEIYINIFDIQGRLIQSKFQGTITAGKHTFKINSGELTPGNYVVGIFSEKEGKKVVEKFIVAQ